MPTEYRNSDHSSWSNLGLLDFADYCDMIEYFNQGEDAFSGYGEWYYSPDTPLPDGCYVIYGGSYGNDNSPGASCYTYAEVYEPEEKQAYLDRLAYLASLPEYEPDTSYSVFVSNTGYVVTDTDEDTARTVFDNYCKMVEQGYGRASEERVVLFRYGEIEEEYEPESTIDSDC